MIFAIGIIVNLRYLLYIIYSQIQNSWTGVKEELVNKISKEHYVKKICKTSLTVLTVIKINRPLLTEM